MQSGKPLFIIFTTVLVDLIGFGMVIPLIGLYGKHYGGSPFQLALLGGIYSWMQFVFSPIWGGLSDRYGRRPILLLSLLGSATSYLIFGLANHFTWLFVARAAGGIFAANISTAQAYIADVTAPEERAKGMGMIGAAFGIGFTLGPPLGGIASAHLGLSAPGLIASAICFTNLILAYFRLPETLVQVLPRASIRRPFPMKLLFQTLRAPHSLQEKDLSLYFLVFFFFTLSFSMMEQTFSLLFQDKFGFSTGEAGYKTGLILMFSGIIGAAVQGGFLRKWVPKYGEKNLLRIGLFLTSLATLLFPFLPTYYSYYLLMIPLAVGTALVSPTLSALISKSAGSQVQGMTLGISQGLGSLGRGLGPFIGLMAFSSFPFLPYLVASFIVLGCAARLFFRDPEPKGYTGAMVHGSS